MKTKLTIDKQIANLKEKGVIFNIMNENDAKKFLRYNNYYFKIKYNIISFTTFSIKRFMFF